MGPRAGGVSMLGRKSAIAGVAVVVLTGLFAGRGDALSQAEAAGRPASGVGSCTLKNWNPNLNPGDAKDLPQGKRPQSYKPDDYNCTGAKFAANGVEFARFPQPHNLHVKNRRTVRSVRACRAGVCHQKRTALARPAQASNPLAP